MTPSDMPAAPPIPDPRCQRSELLQHPYYQTVLLFERLHRQFLDVLKAELDRLGVRDINNIQSLILYNIGDDEMTVGELTSRGYYLGSNVSYNVKKMIENGYLLQRRQDFDRRSTYIRISDKGLELRDGISAVLQRHVTGLEDIGLTPELLDHLNEVLGQIERFWAGTADFARLMRRGDPLTELVFQPQRLG